jgi:ribosomal protein L40E
VKAEQQHCRHCGEKLSDHDVYEGCDYEPKTAQQLRYRTFRGHFNKACKKAGIPENKRRPYNLRHTRLTEVATFMGYEQLNKFAGWKPGSDRAKVYVHLNNDDVNKAIRDQYGINKEQEEDENQNCSFCNAENQPEYSECRNCGRPLNLEEHRSQEDKKQVIERLSQLEDKGVLEKLEELDG